MDEPTQPEDIEPTDAEIAAAADQEAKEAAARARAAKKTPPAPRRGPGRPPGAKNRKPGESEARSRAKSTTTTPKSPSGGTRPKAVTAGPASEDADREARRAHREARSRRVTELTEQVKEHKPGFVIGVGTLSGLPVEYLVQPQTKNGQPVIDSETQQPIPELTVYGHAIAPKDWQIRTCVETYVRVEETDIGQRMVDAADKWAPYLLMVGAVGAVGFYAFTTMQATNALKPMIAEEIRQRAAQQQQQPQPAEDAA